MTTARNRAIDRIRRDRTLANKSRLLELPEALEEPVDETIFPDERLELLFTCCHPALATEALALGRALAELMPDEPEAYGLLAMMLLHDARLGAGLKTIGTCTRRAAVDRRPFAGS